MSSSGAGGNAGQGGSGFWRNALTLAGGNTAARLIIISLVPVVTRLYSPESFGTFNIYLSLSGLVAGISSLRYNAAIMLPSGQEQARHVLLLSLALVAGFSLLTGLAAWSLRPVWHGNGPWKGTASNIFLALWAAVLLEGGMRALSFWLLRLKRFRQLTISRIVDATANRGTTIGCGVLGLITPWGLVLGHLAGRAMGLAVMFRRSRTGASPRIFTSFPVDDIRQAAAHYSRFPRYFYTALLQAASNHLPVLLLWMFFPHAVVGLYALSTRILGEPIQLVANAVQKAFYSHAAERLHNGLPLREPATQVFSHILDLILPPLLSLALLASWLVPLIFGAQWRQTGLFIAILAPAYAAMISTIPLAGLFDLLDRQKERMLFNAAKLAATLTAFALGGLSDRPETALTCFSLLLTAVYLGGAVHLLGLAGTSPRQAAAILAGRTARAAALIALPALLAMTDRGGDLVIAVLCAAITVINTVLAQRHLRNLPGI